MTFLLQIKDSNVTLICFPCLVFFFYYSTSVFVVMAPLYLKMTRHVEIRFQESAGGYSHAGATPILPSYFRPLLFNGIFGINVSLVLPASLKDLPLPKMLLVGN